MVYSSIFKLLTRRPLLTTIHTQHIRARAATSHNLIKLCAAHNTRHPAAPSSHSRQSRASLTPRVSRIRPYEHPCIHAVSCLSVCHAVLVCVLAARPAVDTALNDCECLQQQQTGIRVRSCSSSLSEKADAPVDPHPHPVILTLTLSSSPSPSPLTLTFTLTLTHTPLSTLPH